MRKVLYLSCILVLSKTSLSETDISERVAELTAQIQALGKVLYDTVVALPRGQGANLLANIRRYNHHLRDMIELVHADKNATMAALDTILTGGHPRFLGTPFNHGEKKRILDNFNWTLDDLEQLYADRITAYTYWTDLLLLKNDNYLYDG